jgi:hypothetical protein
MPFGKNEAAYIELVLRNETKKSLLEKMWAVHFNQGKVVRLTHGRFDSDTLTSRSTYRAIIKNVPKVAVESALLRQMKRFNAKAVYISANSNGNQRGLATVYFETAEDLENALKGTAYYYSTKLVWETNIEAPVNRRKQERKYVSKHKQVDCPKESFIQRNDVIPKRIPLADISNSINERNGDKSDGKQMRFQRNYSQNNQIRPQKHEEEHPNIGMLEEILKRLARIEERYGSVEQAQPALRS